MNNMTIEKAIYQLTDLIKDRESFCHRDDFDDVFLQDIEALKIGITALEKQLPKEKTGKWLHDQGKYKNRWICTECSYRWYFPKEEAKYCPNCGAKMEVKENAET